MTKYIEIDGMGEVVPRSEYDALAAQVESVVNIFTYATNTPEMQAVGKILKEVFGGVQQHHLAELRAEAGRDGFFKGVAWILDVDLKDISAMVAEEAAEQYAEQIRREGE